MQRNRKYTHKSITNIEEEIKAVLWLKYNIKYSVGIYYIKFSFTCMITYLKYKDAKNKYKKSRIKIIYQKKKLVHLAGMIES